MAAYAKLQAISDSVDTCTGLGLAEVSCHLAYTPDELHRILENVDPDIGIVMITSGLAAKSKNILEKYQQSTAMPLITIIPDPRSAHL